jgi:hypothetical protein
MLEEILIGLYLPCFGVSGCDLLRTISLPTRQTLDSSKFQNYLLVTSFNKFIFLLFNEAESSLLMKAHLPIPSTDIALQ